MKRFEDLIAWQKARAMRREFVRIAKTGCFGNDWNLIDQMRRAATSVMANIAEGFEKPGPKEFCRYLGHSKASCAEFRSHVYAALDSEYLTQEQFTRLHEMSEEVGRIVGGLKTAIERKDAAPAREADQSVEAAALPSCRP